MVMHCVSRLIHRSGERRIMRFGQLFTLGGIGVCWALHWQA